MILTGAWTEEFEVCWMTGVAAAGADASRSGRPDRASARSFAPKPSRSVSRAESDSSPKSCRSSGRAMDSFFTGILFTLPILPSGKTCVQKESEAELSGN